MAVKIKLNHTILGRAKSASSRYCSAIIAASSLWVNSRMPRRLRSCMPRITATAMTQTEAMTMPGISRRINSPSSTFSAVMMRAVGPPQGSRFMMELDKITITAKSIIFMFNFLYTGISAEQTTSVVVEPSPSTETAKASKAVPTNTFSGSPLITFTIKLTAGLNKPAVSIMPKYRMANSSISAVPATPLMSSFALPIMPAMANLGMSAAV